MTYILWMLIGNSVHAGYMGEFDTLQACQEAILKRYEMGIAPGALHVPAVQEALRTTLKTQREYICVPKSEQ